MTTNTLDTSAATILDNLHGAQDALSVRRAFGEAYMAEGVMVIPVARVGGGAGGGSGEAPDATAKGKGFGTGFGMGAQPIGVYEVSDAKVVWKPAVDVNRMVRGGQVLVGILAVCLTLILRRRR